jgi:hypothetical protein
VPPSSGLLTSSPYLDAHLYRYDDKLINPIIRPRMVSEVTIPSDAAPPQPFLAVTLRLNIVAWLLLRVLWKGNIWDSRIADSAINRSIC